MRMAWAHTQKYHPREVFIAHVSCNFFDDLLFTKHFNPRKSSYPIVEEKEKKQQRNKLEYDFLSDINRFDFSGARIANHVKIYEIEVVPRNRIRVKFGWAIFCHRRCRRRRCATQIQASSKDLLVSIMRKWSFRLAIVMQLHIHQSHAPLNALHGSVNNDRNRFTFAMSFSPPFMSMLIYCTVIGSYDTNKKTHQPSTAAHVYFAHKPGESSAFTPARIYCISHEIDFDCAILVASTSTGCSKARLEWMRFQ